MMSMLLIIPAIEKGMHELQWEVIRYSSDIPDMAAPDFSLPSKVKGLVKGTYVSSGDNEKKKKRLYCHD